MLSHQSIQKCIESGKISNMKKTDLIDFAKKNGISIPDKITVKKICELLKEKVPKESIDKKKKRTKTDLLKLCKEMGLNCKTKMKIKELQAIVDKKQEGIVLAKSESLKELKEICKKRKIKGCTNKKKKKFGN